MAASDGSEERSDKFDSFLIEVKAIEKRDSELTSDKQIERLTKSGSKYLNLNPYEVLQVPTDANEEVIKIAYKRLSILVHPDKNLEDRERAQKAFEALSKANKTLKDGDQVKKIKHVIEEAEATVEKQLREKRKEAKKLNIDSIEEDTDPEKYYKFKRAITAKLFADYEIRRLQLEERTQSERKREREAEIAEEEEVKAKKEWQKQWDEGRNERVDSWRSFQTSKKKKKEKTNRMKPFKPPSLKPETRD
ncbi:dnaJ homolog subfamily C member 8-like [Rhopilema esculentum]|uniref:dnaJ homolog subfamily C member 8-like n=1 Tax=Rhopilema esculentum TaxID=499914 RepID=UPI0031D17BA4